MSPFPVLRNGAMDGGTLDVEIEPLRDDQVDEVVRHLPLHRLGQGDGGYLVAWSAGRPVGHLHLTAATPPEVQDFSVAEDARGKGVGTALLAAAESSCRARGDTCVRMEVSVDNDGARALYARLGYVDAGEAPRRVLGTVQLRTGPLDVDDTLLALEKRL